MKKKLYLLEIPHCSFSFRHKNNGITPLTFLRSKIFFLYAYALRCSYIFRFWRRFEDDLNILLRIFLQKVNIKTSQYIAKIWKKSKKLCYIFIMDLSIFLLSFGQFLNIYQQGLNSEIYFVYSEVYSMSIYSFLLFLKIYN